MTPQPFARADAVLKDKREDLRRTYEGVVGLGVGSSVNRPAPRSDPVYLIVIYLRDREALPDQPQSVEDVPIRFVVTGEFKAQ